MVSGCCAWILSNSDLFAVLLVRRAEDDEKGAGKPDYYAKVADFGLSLRTNLHVQSRKVDNPLWLAPESMQGGQFTM